MKISKSLNFVLPVVRDDGSMLYVHASPVSLEVFEEHAMILAQTFAAIHNQGLGRTSGPRVAALVLKKLALAADAEGMVWKRTQASLINEIYRLANVLIVGEKGWETYMFEDAIARELFDDEEVSEIKNALVFFTLGWRLYKKNIRETMLKGAMELWGGSTTSSNSTEFQTLLQTSKATDNILEKIKA